MSASEKSIYRNFDLFVVLLKREVTNKTSGTLLGWSWLVLQPALQIAAIWFLFGYILHIRYPEQKGGFIGYYLTGMIPWLMISELLQRSLSVFQDYASIYQRNIFPLWILPAVPAALSYFIYMIIFILMCAFLYGPISIPLAIIAISLCFLFILPLLYIISVFSLFVRDFQQFLPFILTMLFYFTPILYRPSEFPKRLGWWLKTNPFAVLIDLVRSLVGGAPLQIISLFEVGLGAVLLASISLILFNRVSPHIREAL